MHNLKLSQLHFCRKYFTQTFLKNPRFCLKRQTYQLAALIDSFEKMTTVLNFLKTFSRNLATLKRKYFILYKIVIKKK